MTRDHETGNHVTGHSGRRRKRPLVLAVLAVTLLAGCARAGGPGATTEPATATGSVPSAGGQIELTVLAAASLQQAFTTIATTFEAEHPGTKVVFGFGGSPTLAEQVTQGAPADVLATASKVTMDVARQADAVGPPTVFARNRLAIAVPPDNPAGIKTLADLANPKVRVVTCQADVPCGAVAKQVLANAGVTVQPVSLEPDVSATVTKVRLGEADAALVYVTDIHAAGGHLIGIPIPDRVNAWTDYPIATVAASPHAQAARAFVATVLGPAGRQALRAAGFALP